MRATSLFEPLAFTSDNYAVPFLTCSEWSTLGEMFSSSEIKIPTTKKDSTCRKEDCLNRRQTSGFCRRHGGGTRCSAEDCARSAQRFGKCHKHGGIRLCSVSGCTKKIEVKGIA